MTMLRSSRKCCFVLAAMVCWTAPLAHGMHEAGTQSPATPPAKQPHSKKSTAKPADIPNTDKTASREKRFEQMLTGATLSGTWQMTTFEDPQHPAKLTKPQPETYTIAGVSKASDDYWLITARIQYADKDVQVPVMVRVIWSGDTPIITVDNFAVPMIGSYSARVMVYRGFYAGTWFGKGYGGVLSGRIAKPQDKEAKKSTNDPTQEPTRKNGESDQPKDRTRGE